MAKVNLILSLPCPHVVIMIVAEFSIPQKEIGDYCHIKS